MACIKFIIKTEWKSTTKSTFQNPKAFIDPTYR